MTVTGRILKGTGGNYEVLYELDGESAVRLCSARGVFRKEGITPTAGDVVDMEPSAEDGEKGSIVLIHGRKNCLIRPAVANLDKLFIVVAPVNPSPSLSTVDKLTAIAVHNGVLPVIILNKTDLADAQGLKDIYSKAGFDVIMASAKHKTGLDGIRAHLRGCLCAFAGASGVGKSSLLNALFPELSQEVNTVSRRTERGRHTTRLVQLFPHAYGGFIADTPGFSVLDFERFDFFNAQDCAAAFPEIYPFTDKCRYTGCTHVRDDGCAVIRAVEEGIIAPSRHESYALLYTQLSKIKPWERRREDNK